MSKRFNIACLAGLIFLAFCVVMFNGTAQEAEHRYIPPYAAKSVLDATLNPISPSLVAFYLEQTERNYVSDLYEGQNERIASVMKNTTDKPGMYQVALGHSLLIDNKDMFGTPLLDEIGYIHLGALTSIDALALRVLLDLSSLGPNEEVWFLDPVNCRAFGPANRTDATPDGYWSPTIFYETMVLMVRSPSPEKPDLGIHALSHFFRLPQDESLRKALYCNINIACETNSTIQGISTAVGLLIIPTGRFDSSLCSGTLINNNTSGTARPYVLTANHCIDANTLVDQTEIIWDYRATQCDGDDAPDRQSLPRSRAQRMLATNRTIDMTLIELDTIPIGTYGRNYAGYTNRVHQIDDQMIGIHHPSGSHMRISYGFVRALNVSSLGIYSGQTEIKWSEGVTEGGSSGSGLFSVSDNYKLVGTLSNGPTHSCVDTSNNYDKYAPFFTFYPQIQSYLEGNGSDPGMDIDCPAKATFGKDAEIVLSLRSFRDKGLRQLPGGNKIIALYYANADAMVRLVRENTEARLAFMSIAAPCASVGRILEASIR